MVSSGAACLALVALPTSHATQPQQFSSVIAGCAFCGGHASPSGSRRRTRGLSSSSSSSSSTPACSPLLLGRGVGVSSACRGRTGIFVAAASRWQDDGDEDDDGDEVRRTRGGRKPLRAPWEDIQWSNPNAKGGRGGERVEWEDKEEEDEDVRGLGERRRRRADLRDDDDDDDDRPRRRRGRGRRADDLDKDTEPTPSGWDASGWFSGAQQANQGGLFDWARSFYNTLFWYGGASSNDDDELPAMNFQDLLERYDLPAIEQSSARPRPIVPPEDLAAEQDFRWQPSGRDSAAGRATGERTSRRRGKPRSSPTNAASSKRRATRDRAREPEREEGEGFRRRGGGRRVTGGPRGGGSRGDAAEIGQLRRKQRQLADREHKCEVDLEKVRERLGVVDATVELWMRRSAGMLSRGGSETDTDVLQAKRRIYGLKDEGRQLDSATVELDGRLEDCRAKLDRIVQELELLGEDAVPQAFYTPFEDKEGEFETAEAETQTRKQSADTASGLETKVVEIEMDGLGLEPEKKRDAEAVPAVGEADI